VTFDEYKGHVIAGLVVIAIPLTVVGIAVATVVWLLAWPLALLGLIAERWYHGPFPWEQPPDPDGPSSTV